MRGREQHRERGGLEISSLSAIEHVLNHKPTRVKRLVIDGKPNNNRLHDLVGLAKSVGVDVDFGGFIRKAGESQDVARAQLEPFEYTDFKEFVAALPQTGRALVLALDHLQDPQNFGALCRTAEALGVQGIIIPKDRSVSVSSGVYAASVGAVETLPIIQVSNIGESLKRLKDAGYWVLGSKLAPESKSPADTPDFERAVLVLGTELEGLSDIVTKACDWLLEIPMRGAVQSLNVSAAGAILMYEILRKELLQPKK